MDAFQKHEPQRAQRTQKKKYQDLFQGEHNYFQNMELRTEIYRLLKQKPLNLLCAFCVLCG
ncbi:MAG: hypothetical protein CMN28_01405 [Salinisphaeraceae bacterium]|nr:hypothetical protein [Salinisphaeraceae bacterium]